MSCRGRQGPPGWAAVRRNALLVRRQVQDRGKRKTWRREKVSAESVVQSMQYYNTCNVKLKHDTLF